MGYPGWLWSQGYDYADRERDVRAMFTMAADADELMAAYGIDYVVVGHQEKEQLQAAHARLRDRYPVAIRTTTYEVFDVRHRETE